MPSTPTSAVYWLTLAGGEGAPKRMSAIDGTPAGGNGGHRIQRHRAPRKRWALRPDGPGIRQPGPLVFCHLHPRRRLGPGLGAQCRGPDSLYVALPGALDTGTVTIELFATFDQDHEITVAVNGTGYGSVAWSGVEYQRITTGKRAAARRDQHRVPGLLFG